MKRRSSPSPPAAFHVPGMSVAPLVLSPEVIHEVPLPAVLQLEPSDAVCADAVFSSVDTAGEAGSSCQKVLSVRTSQNLHPSLHALTAGLCLFPRPH